MTIKKLSRLFPLGALMLAIGLIVHKLTLHNWMHARYFEFASGVLIGVAIVFMIAGLLSASKATLAR